MIKLFKELSTNFISFDKFPKYIRLIMQLGAIALITILIVSIFLLSISTSQMTVDKSKVNGYLTGIGHYGKEPSLFVNEDNYYSPSIISTWITQETDKLKLAYMIYRYICLTLSTTKQKSWHLYGNGIVSTGNASGELIASGYRYEKKNNTAYGSDSILQNVNILSNLSGNAFDITLLEIARQIVEYGEQRIYLNDYEYIRTADKNSFNTNNEYEIASASFSQKFDRYNNKSRKEYKKNKGYVYRDYDTDWYDEYGLSSPEKTDHIINTESILEDSILINENYINNNKMFVVSFDIDTNKILSNGTTSTYYFEQFIINHLDLYDSNFSAFNVNVKYNSLNITLEVWDCGYLRSWTTHENWTVTANLPILPSIKIPATTEITTKEYYSYDPNDNLYDDLYNEFSKNTNYIEYDAHK